LTTPHGIWQVKTKLPHRVGETGHPRRRFWCNRNIWPTRNTQREANYAQLASRSFGLVLLMRVFLFRQCSPCSPESCLLKSLRIFKLVALTAHLPLHLRGRAI
jgi:hypothetical protein